MPQTPRQIYVAIIGLGGVGTAFLSQFEALAHRLSSHPSQPTHLHLIYASRSTRALLAEYHNPLSPATTVSALALAETPPLTHDKLIDYLQKAPGRAILVDNTSAQDVAEAYPSFLARGISVITPNKKAFSASMQLWDAIHSAAANGTAPEPTKAGAVFHESSVCACMPVITTLKDLVETGDAVRRIEGVLSGTLSYLFNNFMPVSGSGGGKFSEEVKKAKDLGYTEPDPRDDLGGMDVARKVVILARLVGMRVSVGEFEVQSLVPKNLEDVKSGDEFVSRLGEFDDQVEQLKEDAKAEGKILRYVGSVDVEKGVVDVGLKKFDLSAPVAALRGSEAMISFYTRRYGERPLVIVGAGAGGEATAMGVTADLIRTLNLVR